MQTAYEDLRRSIRIPFLIIGILILIHVVGAFSVISDGNMSIRILLVLTPLVVCVFCFVVSKWYDHSKVFGRSIFLLGLAYLCVFFGEAVFYYFFDTLHLENFSKMGEAFFFVSYLLMIGHIMINVRYFVERLEKFQIGLLVVLPAVIILGYAITVASTPDVVQEDFYYNLLFVSVSSVVLGASAVAFTLFRRTAMDSAWFVILIGITIGTIGDLVYNYAYTLNIYDFGNFSSPLWNSSHLIMMYALYKHQKSI